MSNIYQSFIPPAFNAETLQTKISEAQRFYDQCEIVMTHDFASALSELKLKEKAGYVLDTSFVPVMLPNGYGNGGLYQLRMFKPEKMVKAAFKDIEKDVTTEYTAFIESEKERAVKAMALRLVAEEEQRISKEAEAAKEARLTAARQEAQTILFGEPV